MKQTRSQYVRTLAIAPSTRGFGFALMEGLDTLVDWGGKPVKTGDKNAQSLAKVKDLIILYQPEVIVLQDTSIKTSRRADRIKVLCRKIIAMAGRRKIRVALFSYEAIRSAFFAKGQGTKHQLAELIANRFPEELGPHLPPKRRPWESEYARMDIFDAVALALMLRLKRTK